MLFAVYANNVAIHQLYPNLQLIAYDEWHTLNRYTVSLHCCVCKTPCWDCMHIIHRPLAGLRRVRLSASCHTVYRLHVWHNSLCDVPAPRSARSQPNDVFSTGFRDLVCSCLPMLHHMIWWASQRFHISFSNLVVETPEYVPMFLEWDLIQQTCSPHKLCMPPFPGPNISVACIQGKPELWDTNCRFVWIYLCVDSTQGI